MRTEDIKYVYDMIKYGCLASCHKFVVATKTASITPAAAANNNNNSVRALVCIL